MRVFINFNLYFAICFRYEYELVVVPGLILNDSIKPIVRKIAKEPPLLINPDQLGGQLAAGKTFTMGIRSKTANNVSTERPHIFKCISTCTMKFHVFHFSFSSLQNIYYSAIHEIEHIEIQPDAWLSQVLPSKSSAWMVIIPMLLVIGMGGIVFYMVRRHRRLSNSFSRFANSHYDTKTGTTRIGEEDNFDHHHHHHPHHHNSSDNINDLPRFDDDEPLVLT